MKVISIISQKGGASKTTLAIHLAVEAIADGKEAMIIDLDPQASATKWKDLREAEDPVVISAQASRLEHNLNIAREAGAELVIIDNAPHSDNSALLSCKQSDLVLIPSKIGILDLQTVPDSINIAQLAGAKNIVIVMSAIPYKGNIISEARVILDNLGVVVSPCTIAQRVIFSHSLNEGKTAKEVEPTGKASREIEQLYKWLLNILY